MIYQISSGQGPAECELGVSKLLQYLQSHYDISLLDDSPGYYPDTYRSVRFSTEVDLHDYIGSVQWIWQSTYRPGHKRKNWFLDFSECSVAMIECFDENVITFETFRSGGNGGQNMNKVETGVRAIYGNSGLSSVCTEERSQSQNKQRAVEKLRKAFSLANEQRKAQAINEGWKRHTQIIRGAASKKFKGMDFQPF